MKAYTAPFILDTIKNTSTSNLSFSIVSLGSTHESFILSLTIGQQITGLDLAFGPQEYKDVPIPKGYRIINQGLYTAFSTLSILFDRTENPLIDIPYEYDHRSLALPYLYYVLLYCNERPIQELYSHEHERKCYILTIQDTCHSALMYCYDIVKSN